MDTAFYEKRIAHFTEQATHWQKRFNQLVVVRLLLALGVIGAIILTFGLDNKWYGGILLVAMIIAFAAAIKQHLKVKKSLDMSRTLLRINQQELRALGNDITEFATGTAFITQGHANAHDVDLFGEKSLYQHIWRDATLHGEAKLADGMLQTQHDPEAISQMQQLLKDLANDTDWRQNLQALAFLHKPKKHAEGRLAEWLDEAAIFWHKRGWLKPLLWISPAIAITLWGLVFSGFLPGIVAVVYSLAQLTFVGNFLKPINAMHARLGKKQQVLEQYAILLKQIELLTTHHSKTTQWKQEAAGGSQAIKQLNRLVSLLDSRLNVLMGIVLNALLLWDIRQVLRIEQWKHRYLQKSQKWINLIADVEAHSMLANFVFNHPTFSWPSFSDDYVIQAQQMGHPLLPEKGRVDNDFNLKTNGQVVLLSGANMSGKSTFLRTVGLNMVLAEMGLPVCAQSFNCKPLPVFTSMRINDSLQNQESYFYAELKRLAYIMDKVKAGEEMLVLLDEILRGTNSNDKHEGSRQLMVQLVKRHTSGIVASHDIALASLAEEYPGAVINKRFEVENADGELQFDYTLRDGVCQNLNASYLMQKMGITE